MRTCRHCASESSQARLVLGSAGLRCRARVPISGMDWRRHQKPVVAVVRRLDNNAPDLASASKVCEHLPDAEYNSSRLGSSAKAVAPGQCPSLRPLGMTGTSYPSTLVLAWLRALASRTFLGLPATGGFKPVALAQLRITFCVEGRCRSSHAAPRARPVSQDLRAFFTPRDTRWLG